MHNKSNQYIYVKDRMGEFIGYLDNLQPCSEDYAFVIIIAERNRNGQWHSESRDIAMGVNLKKVAEYKCYEDYEDFFAEFIEAIL